MRHIALVVVAVLLVALTGCKETATVETTDRLAMAFPDDEMPEGAVSTDVAPEIPEIEDLPGSNVFWSNAYLPTEDEFPGMMQGAITPSSPPYDDVIINEIRGRLVRHHGLLYLQCYVDIENCCDRFLIDIKYKLIINEQEPRNDSMTIVDHALWSKWDFRQVVFMTPEPIEPIERLHSLRAKIVGYRDAP